MRKKLISFVICSLLMCVFFINGCITQENNEETEDYEDYDRTDYTIQERILPEVNDWLYQLQNINLHAIGEAKFDLVVMDYSLDGSDETAFTKSEIEGLRNSSSGKKVVVSYISIGKAEYYRYYWDPLWDSNPPSFFESENPKGEDNFWVRYWDKAWQDIIFGSNDSYVDKIITAGFDGIYLDIVDGYKHFEDKGRVTAADEMVEFIREISRYCKVDKNLTNFLIIPQNAEGLAVHQDYLEAVDGLGKEDLFYYGNDKQSVEDINYSIQLIDEFKKEGKIVLSVDYCTMTETIEDYYVKANEKGYIPYSTDRELDILTINLGHEPD
jgi:cysteinyl-tRNA synthetase